MANKNLLDGVSIISFVLVLLFLFFAFFLLTVKTNNKTRNRLLASFLTITALDISAFFYYRYFALPPDIEMLRAICISFLKSPLLYFYVLSLIYTDFRLKPRHALHLLPFLLAVFILLPRFFLKNSAEQHFYFQHFNEMKEIRFLMNTLKLQSLVYIVANLMLLKKYKTLLFENYASNISLLNYQWLSQLVAVIITLNVVTLVKDLFKQTSYIDVANGLTILMLTGGVAFIFWIVLNALYYPDLFRGIDANLQPVEKLMAEASKNKKIVSLPENDEQIQKLKDYMKLKAPYLEPSLTIQDLANQLKMPVKDLSILINHHLNQHFFDFINAYRIDKAIEILKDTDRAGFTVLEILYEVGFNSKSSFNTAFKKHTSLTPTQYRKTHIL